MATIGVVVAAKDVEEFILDALNSIDFAHVHHVIVIDDASEDKTPELVAQFTREAADGGRVEFVRLEENVGLGQARNIGLDRLTTDYVMFLDGDDWFRSDIFPLIHRELDAAAYDLVFFSHQRVSPDGKVGQAVGLRQLESLRQQQTQDASAFISFFHSAWNKVYRREFINATGILFQEGLYEDVSWTYPLIVSAETFSAIPEVGVLYRHRPGSITKSMTDQHFDILTQVDHLLAFLERAESGNHVVARAIYRRVSKVVYHVVEVGDRLPKMHVERFVSKMSSTLERWQDFLGASAVPDWRLFVISRLHPSVYIGLLPLMRRYRRFLPWLGSKLSWLAGKRSHPT